MHGLARQQQLLQCNQDLVLTFRQLLCNLIRIWKLARPKLVDCKLYDMLERSQFEGNTRVK